MIARRPEDEFFAAATHEEHGLECADKRQHSSARRRRRKSGSKRRLVQALQHPHDSLPGRQDRLREEGAMQSRPAPQHRHAGLAHGSAAQLPAQHSQRAGTLGTLYGGVPEGGGTGRHLFHSLHDHHDYYLTFILWHFI